MTSSLIAPVFAFRTLAEIDPSAAGQHASGVIGLAVVALIVFVALTGFLIWRVRATRPRHAHRGRPLVPSAWGQARGIDPDAAATDSVPRPSHRHTHRRS